MFSTRKTSQGKDSERENGFKLDFLVHGSSVPIHNQQPKTSRECRTCQNATKERKRKEFPFPVDKIIYLSERLELTSLTEKKIQTISVSAVDIESKNSFRGFEGENKSGGDEKKKICDFDFSLDLSSVCNAGDESDRSEETFPHYNSESSSGKEVCETSRALCCSSRPYDIPKSQNSDSVNAYVNTVNKQKDLVRFFRPCHACNEPYCVCPRSPPRSANPSGRYDSACSGTSFQDSGTACECTNCPLFGKKVRFLECCCSENFDLFPPLCGEECECRTESPVSDRILAYTSSLASAARSARVLARDLELVLSTLNSETEESRGRGFGLEVGPDEGASGLRHSFAGSNDS